MPLRGVEVGFRGWDLELEVSTEPHACVQGGGYLPDTPKGVRAIDSVGLLGGP